MPYKVSPSSAHIICSVSSPLSPPTYSIHLCIKEFTNWRNTRPFDVIPKHWFAFSRMVGPFAWSVLKSMWLPHCNCFAFIWIFRAPTDRTVQVYRRDHTVSWRHPSGGKPPTPLGSMHRCQLFELTSRWRRRYRNMAVLTEQATDLFAQACQRSRLHIQEVMHWLEVARHMVTFLFIGRKEWELKCPF